MESKKLTKSGAREKSHSLVDRLSLFAIGLDSLNAKLDRNNYAAAHAKDGKQVTRRFESKYAVTNYGKKHFDITGVLLLRLEAAGFNDPILSLDVVITGHFHPKAALSRPEAQKFAGAEARLIFWPFFRQVVVDTTARMHIGTITLPLLSS